MSTDMQELLVVREDARLMEGDGELVKGWSDEELKAEIRELTTRLERRLYRWLVLVRELDVRRLWEAEGFVSCAHWLSVHCDLTVATARERLRVAYALVELPKVAEAMRAGEVSYSKIREVARVATSENEERFLDVARSGTTHDVERAVRQYRRPEAEELSREEKQQAGRMLSHYYEDEDGSLVVSGRMPAESGALFVRALEAAQEEVKKRERDGLKKGEPSPINWLARRSDALGVIVESFLKGGQGELSSGERKLIVLHVDEATLREGREGRCWLTDGPAIALETARRFGCDSSVRVLVEDERGEALDVGRRTRTIPAALRLALETRDRGCRFPGCTNTKLGSLEGHHIKHWAEGGATKLSNLILTCWAHHRCLHERGFKVEVLEDGGFRFFGPDGRVLDDHIRDVSAHANSD